MRYWIFEDDRLEGPFTPEELAARPRFTGKTLVHPEEKQLLVAERWVPAYDIPQLAPVLAAKERAVHGKSFMPPDPAVRDLPVLGAVLEQTERLERVLVGMRRELEDDAAALETLREDGRRKDARAAELEAADAALAQRLSALEPLRDELSKLAATFSASEAQRNALASKLDALVSQLSAETARVKELAAELPERWRRHEEAEAFLRGGLEDERKERLALEEAHSARFLEAEAARTALEAELARRREADAEAEAARWMLKRLPLSPRGLFALALTALLLAGTALALILWPRKSPSPPAPSPAPVPAPVPEPVKAPEPPPPAAKPRPKPRPRAETKEEKEKRIKATILLRATGGVPSSNKKAAQDLRKLSDDSAEGVKP